MEDFPGMRRLAVLVLLLLAATGWAQWPFEGKRCQVCQRPIQEPRLAVWGQGKFFDEPGCMLKFRAQELCAMEQMEFDQAAWAVDYLTGRQIPLSEALLVKAPSVKTPNGYGLVFVGTSAASDKLGGRALSYSDWSYADYQELLE
jgi:hypothetical protein